MNGLREMRDASPDRGARGDRRWFASERLDLYVWERGGIVESFELCYDKPHDEHSLRWTRGRGFTHDRIDDGETGPWRNDAPIAIPDGLLDLERVALEFEREAAALDPRLYRAVLGALHRG